MYFFKREGKNIISNIIATIAESIVIKASWLMDLNSENSNGNNVTTITIVVLTMALNVFFLQ